MTPQNALTNKIDFLAEHPLMLLYKVSYYFPFTHVELRKYKPILIWEYVGGNTAIKWDISIIDEFQNLLFNKDYGIEEPNFNESLPWSIDFIERYLPLWNWESLSQNDKIMNNSELKQHFKLQLLPYLDPIQEGINKKNALKSFGDLEIEKLENHEYSFNKIKEWQIADAQDIDITENIDWVRLSQNELLPWSPELIAKHKDNWNWDSLIFNKNINWDLNLLKLYENKLPWYYGTTLEEYYPFRHIITSSLSDNLYIIWDREMIFNFKHKLNFFYISTNSLIDWNIDLLQEFSDYWDYQDLSMNKTVWEKAFPEFEESKNVMPLLDLLLKKNEETLN